MEFCCVEIRVYCRSSRICFAKIADIPYMRIWYMSRCVAFLTALHESFKKIQFMNKSFYEMKFIEVQTKKKRKSKII